MRCVAPPLHLKRYVFFSSLFLSVDFVALNTIGGLQGQKQTLEGVAKKMPVGDVCPVIKYLVLLIIVTQFIQISSETLLLLH